MAKLRQLELPMPIRRVHHHDVDLNTVDPVDAVHPLSLDRHPAFRRHAELSEESDRAVEIFYHDDDVVQPLDRHAADTQDVGGSSLPSSRHVTRITPLSLSACLNSGLFSTS